MPVRTAWPLTAARPAAAPAARTLPLPPSPARQAGLDPWPSRTVPIDLDRMAQGERKP